MRSRFILLICAAALLSGCMTNSALTETSKGMTMEQLAASQSSVKSITWGLAGEVSCYRCDGQSTRTYTDKAGNQVAAYLYWGTFNVSGYCYRHHDCRDPYSFCFMAEQQFEFVDNVVARARWVTSKGEGYADPKPLHSNACDGHPPYIKDSEINTVWYGYTSW